MSSDSQITKQDIESINDEDFFEGLPNESRELFERVLAEILDAEIRRIEKKSKDMKMPQYSRRHKIRINRLFRERVGVSLLPFPEVDNLYERVRSKLVVTLKINEFQERHKARRRTK